MAITLDNFVRSVLSQDATAADNTLVLALAAAPLRDPPAASAAAPGVLILQDVPSAPTKIEIVRYTGRNIVGGNVTLTGVTRAQEGTVAQAWTAGTPTFQGWTAGILSDIQTSKLDVTGTAAAALRLANARMFSLSGVITAPAVAFDGTGNLTLATSIADGALTIAKTSGLQAALDAKLGTTGTAAAATKLATARTLGLSGVISGSASFDGTANATIATTITDGALSISKTSGLQAALDGKLNLIGGTLTGALGGTSAIFSGAVTSGSAVTASGVVQSSTTTCILATTGAGAVYLRPNGQASASGQVAVDANGNLGVNTFPTSVAGLGNPVLGAGNIVAYNAGNIGLILCTDSAAARTQQMGFAAAGISTFDAGLQYSTGTRALSLFAGAAARATLDSFGNFTVTTSGSTSTITVNDGGGNGSNIKLAGNGSNPSKWIRAQGGNFQVMNNAYGTILNGTDAGVWSAADFQATSDLTVKQGIKPLRRGVSALKQMRPIEYTIGGKRQIGFGAQHAQRVIPEAVSRDQQTGLLQLSYGQVTALLGDALLEVEHRLTMLEAR